MRKLEAHRPLVQSALRFEFASRSLWPMANGLWGFWDDFMSVLFVLFVSFVAFLSELQFGHEREVVRV